MKMAAAAHGKGTGRVSNPPLRHDLATLAIYSNDSKEGRLACLIKSEQLHPVLSLGWR